MPGISSLHFEPGPTAVRLATIGAAIGLVAAMVGPVAAVAPKRSLGHQSTAKITRIGTAHVGRTSAGSEPTTIDQTRPDPDEAREESVNRAIPNSMSAARVPSSHVPRPAALPVADATGGTGFDGLNHFDQRTAGTGDYVNT